MARCIMRSSYSKNQKHSLNYIDYINKQGPLFGTEENIGPSGAKYGFKSSP